jgi:D-3-phosphoglycerate dehydrogenase
MTTAGFDRKRVVLIADAISEAGVALLRERPELDVRHLPTLSQAQFVEAAREADAILVRSRTVVTSEVLTAATRLAVIGRAGIGVDNVDVAAATARGVLVMNCPEATADTTAEHTIALLLALARRIPAADRAVRRGNADRSQLTGVEIKDKVLGILGGGNVGRRVASRARALGMEPIVYDPLLAPDALREHGATVLPLEVVLAKSEFLSVHIPLTDQTRGFVDAAMMARMRDGAYLVNCARGGIVDEAALLAALASGKLAGAAIDVFEHEPPPADHPLLQRDDVIATPHLGASTRESMARASLEICRQVIAFLLDGELRNAVNLPRLGGGSWRTFAPWLDLGRRLGRLAAALALPGATRLEVALHGRLAQLDGAPITRAVAAGYASRRLVARDTDAGATGEPRTIRAINEVNALDLLREAGVLVAERRTEHMRDFAGMLAVHVGTGEHRTRVAGTLFGHRQPRIVKIDEHSLEALADGTLLLVRNEDRPGVVGRIGTLLGELGVNIKAMHLSPPRTDGGGGDALAALGIEPPLEEAALDRLAKLADVHSVVQVELDD